jgi:alginate lyase
MDATDQPSPDRHRSRIGILAGAAVALAGIALIGGGLATRGGPAPRPSPPGTPVASSTAAASHGSTSVGYLVPPADLADRAAKATNGLEPWATAKADLLATAQEALKGAPQPSASLDIPGTEGPFVDDTATAYGLALSYALTGDPRYASGARTYIDAWVSTTTSLENACQTDGSCQTSLIVARVVPGFVFAADLIRGSGVWSAADESALRTWLHDLILPNLPVRAGNWGDAGDFSRAAITDFLGDSAGFAKALDEWRARMDAVPADGHLPDEVRRGSDGMSYTQEALQYKVAVARLAELRGVDLWSYVGAQGATLRDAIGVLERYWFDPRAWPYDPGVTVPSPSPMWEIAYQHWQDPGWPAIFAADRPFGADAHSAIRWTTLTNGIPIP